MTEAEWHTSDDPMVMLSQIAGTASDRKLRLFAVACCYRIWPLMSDAGSRTAVQVAEDFADGRVPAPTLQAVAVEAATILTNAEAVYNETVNESTYAGDDDEIAAGWRLLVGVASSTSAVAVTSFIIRSTAERVSRAANESAAWAAHAASWEAGRGRENGGGVENSERPAQADLLRDIFGDTFRPVTPDPDWRTSTVVALARGIYDDREFDRLPLLADALQDAGCENVAVLDHCRDPRLTHVRGCWVVDLVLGLS